MSLDPCPRCGALPCDWVDNPHETRNVYEFDRYINGVRMAEDVIIEQQTTLEGAMREAARIASRGKNGEVPVLVLRAPSPSPAPGVVADSLWVPAKPEHKKIGWTYDFDQTERIASAAYDSTGYDAVMEVVEFIMAEADRRHKSTLSNPPAQPGWQLVPEEPTEAMIDAGEGFNIRCGCPDCDHSVGEKIAEGWRAMLAAAPLPGGAK